MIRSDVRRSFICHNFAIRKPASFVCSDIFRFVTSCIPCKLLKAKNALPFRIRTYGNKDLMSFRIRTYEKDGRGRATGDTLKLAPLF